MRERWSRRPVRAGAVPGDLGLVGKQNVLAVGDRGGLEVGGEPVELGLQPVTDAGVVVQSLLDDRLEGVGFEAVGDAEREVEGVCGQLGAAGPRGASCGSPSAPLEAKGCPPRPDRDSLLRFGLSAGG